MKQYNIHPEKRKLSFGELNVLSLGERGRGRYETLVPVQGNLVESDFVELAPTKSGNIKVIKGSNPEGWLARISCCGCYTRNTEGRAYVHKQDDRNVTVLSAGNGAEGDAGRIGNWDDLLLKVNDKTLIRVKQHGGSKIDPYYLYFDTDKVTRIPCEEIRLFCEQNNYSYGETMVDYFNEIETPLH